MAKKIRKSTLKSRKRGVPAQKQKQSQRVEQKVIVRIGDVSKKKSRRRRTTRKPKEQSDNSMMQSLQPNVIYQSYKPEQTSSSQPTQNLPLETAPTVKNMVPETVKQPTARGAFEDVGVGTEGFVSILEKQTKREQLEQLMTPVAKVEQGELPPWLQDTKPNPAFVAPTYFEPIQEKKTPEISPIKPSVDSPPFQPIPSFETPFTPEKFPSLSSSPEKFTPEPPSRVKEMIDKLNKTADEIDLENTREFMSLPKRISPVKKMSQDITMSRLFSPFVEEKPEPTFFEKLQLQEIPEVKKEKPKKVPAKRGITKKVLTIEEQKEKRLAINAKARLRYASKKEQQQTVPIY